MKFYLVVLLAGLCTTIVTAAPPLTTPNFSFQEYNTIIDLSQALKSYWINLGCINDVITMVVSGSEFESTWHTTERDIKKLIDIEWKRCADSEEFIREVKCKADIVQKSAGLVYEFFQKLIDADKWDLMKELREKVISECVHKNDTSIQFNIQDEQYENPLYGQFKCLVDVLGRVSLSRGLEDLWTKYQPKLKQCLGRWKECENTGETMLVMICHIKEAATGLTISFEYIRSAATRDQQFVPDFVNQFKKDCIGMSNADEFYEMFAVDGTDDCVEKIVEKLKCITEAISDAVKKTEFQKLWQNYKQDMEKIQNRLSTCRNEISASEVSRCIRTEFKKSLRIVDTFLGNLKTANSDVGEKAKELIRERCYA